MRRLHLLAVPSDAFLADGAVPVGVLAPDPDGEISLLVNPSYAKRFQLADEFDVMFHERE